MKKTILGTCACFLLIGCGGSGGGGGGAVSSPFLGNWAGTYSAPEVQDSGSFGGGIAADGTVSVVSHSYPSGVDSTILGTVQPNGDFTGTVKSPGYQPSTLSGRLTLRNNKTEMTGALTQTSGGQSWQVTISTFKQN